MSKLNKYLATCSGPIITEHMYVVTVASFSTNSYILYTETKCMSCIVDILQKRDLNQDVFWLEFNKLIPSSSNLHAEVPLGKIVNKKNAAAT